MKSHAHFSSSSPPTPLLPPTLSAHIRLTLIYLCIFRTECVFNTFILHLYLLTHMVNFRMSYRNRTQFVSTKATKNPQETLNVYTKWIKCQQVLKDAFPGARQTQFAQKLRLYGAQRYWLPTWIERFHRAKNVGEADLSINNGWATLALHYLDQIWPKLDSPAEHTLEQLEAINQLTNKIKGHQLNAAGISAVCLEPDRIEGFIDLFDDSTENEATTLWANTKFIK